MRSLILGFLVPLSGSILILFYYNCDVFNNREFGGKKKKKRQSAITTQTSLQKVPNSSPQNKLFRAVSNWEQGLLATTDLHMSS